MNKNKFILFQNKIKKAFYTLFTGTAGELIAIGESAGLNDLQDNAFTVDGYWKQSALGQGTGGAFISKDGGTGGWILYVDATPQIIGFLKSATSDAMSFIGHPGADNLWHHYEFNYNDAGDRKIHIYLDGVLLTGTEIAGVGAIITDATIPVCLGNNGALGIKSWAGGIGWVRISNVVRHTAAFTPPSRLTPPAVDANTLALWKMDEGTGLTSDNAEGTAERDGTLAQVTWAKE